MINSMPDTGPENSPDDDVKVNAVVMHGPNGAVTLAGIATAIVIGLWFLFYFAVFLPRGVMQ